MQSIVAKIYQCLQDWGELEKGLEGHEEMCGCDRCVQCLVCDDDVCAYWNLSDFVH